ncbi:hypothetical protein TNIN_31401 [Trichonephila inaurata madagascariensis]|uniref:Uncharacterized protein n=1 Tax=Trichonephila inaurata madagascariensis TaxID=2747483 RepID=A0A8X7CIA0_9ARAC|nr:hypothetical protein TNIN_31401 [Trichonephila inaurata madagascariensis]
MVANNCCCCLSLDVEKPTPGPKDLVAQEVQKSFLPPLNAPGDTQTKGDGKGWGGGTEKRGGKILSPFWSFIGLKCALLNLAQTDWKGCTIKRVLDD